MNKERVAIWRCTTCGNEMLLPLTEVPNQCEGECASVVFDKVGEREKDQ